MANGQRRKLAFRILIIPLTLIAFALYMYFSEGITTIGTVFRTLNYKYVLCAFGVFTLGLLCEQASVAFMRHHYQKRFPFWYVTHSTLLADFWELITPGTFAFGPITQVQCMNKQGIPPSKGAAVMLVNQSCSMISITVFPLFLVFMNISYLSERMNWILWVFFALAMSVNLATVFIYMFVPRQDKFFIKVGSGIIRFLHKIHIIRKEERRDVLLKKTEDQVTKLKNNMVNLDYKAYEWIISILIMIGYRICIYSVHYFSALALGIDCTGKFFVLMAAQAIVNNISSALPIPGGLGITDMAILLIFNPIIGNVSSVNFMMLFYRIITYYYPLLLGAIMLFFKIPTGGGKLERLDGYTEIGDQNEKTQH